jgi:NAD+ kinase
MKRVGVLVHPTRPVARALETLRQWTSERGLELVQIRAGEQPEVAPEGDVTACDLVAALGGDGTVLAALHAAAVSRTPVMGVAYGSLGAITTVPEPELRAGLDRFAAGDWAARRLPALSVDTPNGTVGWAINDIVLARKGSTQLIVEVSVAGELYARLAGDGVILATPLGSSAYSMAAGGPLLSADLNALVCTPLAMHGGCAPPLVIAGSQEVTLEAHPGHGGFDVEIDGFERQIAAERLRFIIKHDPEYTTLVDLGEVNAGLSGLRNRGLIADSPRVLFHDARVAGPAPTVTPTPGR